METSWSLDEDPPVEPVILRIRILCSYLLGTFLDASVLDIDIVVDEAAFMLVSRLFSLFLFDLINGFIY